jgi:hypothetical protein
MKIHRFLIPLMGLLLLASCGLETGGTGPYHVIWVDGPVEKETYVNTSVSITVHSNYELSEVFIKYKLPYSNSVHLATVPMRQVGSTIYEGITVWVPTFPGEYNLIAHSADGVVSSVRYLKVLPQPTPSPSPTPEAKSLPMTADTPIPTTAPPTILPDIQFSADAYTLTAGECTFLRWSTVFVESAYLNGERVELMHSRQVCPVASSTYTLRGESSVGSIEKSLTIRVSPPEVPPPSPPDTQGPSITGITKSAESIFDNTSCGLASNTISASVTDDSGVSEVVLWFRAKNNYSATPGEWRSLTMTNTGGNTYQAVLGISQLASSLSFYADGIVEFYIIAKDSAGNFTQSGVRTFTTKMCLI